MKLVNNISGRRLLQTFLISLVVTIVVWIPLEALFLFNQARHISHFVEEDTLLFVTRMRSTLSASESLDIVQLNNNRDVFNLYQATIDDKVTLIQKDILTQAQKKKSESTYDGLSHHKKSFHRKIILRMLSASELGFLNQEPVANDDAVRAYKKGDKYYYEMTTIFKNNDDVYTLSLQRDLGEIYGRFMRMDLDSIGGKFWCIIFTTVTASSFMVYYTAVRHRNTIVKQTQAVALSHGDAPNIGKGQMPQIKEACDAIIALGKRLDEANERSINALADVSHAVASHLAQIKQSIDLIRYYGSEENEAVETQMKRIENNSARIAEVNNTIANLAKLERGKIVISPQVFELQELINLAVDFAKNQYPSYKIENPRGGKSKKISIRREHFLLIVEALIQNAVKYTNSDEKKIVIACMEHKAPTGMVQFFVKNWGIGIPKGEESRIFERYYRGSNTSHTKTGVGLGLHMVYKLVKLYDGDITVESEREYDHTYETTFIITFKEYEE